MKLINVIIISLLVLSTIFVTTFFLYEWNANELRKQKESKKLQYDFIWDEFEDAPGYLLGDDSLLFGPTLGVYHNYTELENKLIKLELAFPDIADLFSIGKSFFGREIYTIRLTDESVTSSKTEILIVAQHHAREQITRENALYFIDKLVNDSLDPSSYVFNLLSQKEIYIIPSLNPDGVEILSRFPWMRKTARPVDEDGDGTDDEFEVSDINGDGYIDRYYKNNGVDWIIYGHEGIDLDNDDKTGEDAPGGIDPNRNYDVQFGNQSGASSEPVNEDYHGPFPFSENCTARFRDFILERNFETAISLHSGIELIIGPWSWSNSPPEGPITEFYDTLGNELSSITGIPYDFLYPVTGEWGDWMFSLNNKLIEFTIEVYGNGSAIVGNYDPITEIYHERGIWDMFNPPANTVIENSAKVFQGLLYLTQNGQYNP